ncbi:unnamed protein product [Ceutorhynchus assimilis]|uniref:Peptidoglycan-recognition protein n=1 Tax=Ceutorhynchus assimilis TaxID=467358 RepID=A0A9N9MF37_9CUCU|nr:unnamed protein product [Ceutorhynchus assimilis]
MKSLFVITGLGLILEMVLADGGPDWPAICPDIITKARWGARKSHSVEYAIVPVPNVIVHHTVTPSCDTEEKCSGTLREIQNYHIDTMEYDDIGYNFIIGGDGNVYEGVGWHKIGAHARGFNSKSIGIAFIGDYSDNRPSEKMLKALKNLLACGLELGELHKEYKLLGARQVMATASPGSALFSEIKTWAHFTRNT